jgi:hypothetical protein
MDKKILLAFIIGSSLPSVLISNLYIGLANSKKNIIKRYEFFPLSIALLFGIYNIINYLLFKKLKNDNSAIIMGILYGLTLSLIGRFIFNLPTRLFQFSKKNEYMVHIYASILYALIFFLIIQNLNKMFLFN